MKKKPGSRTLQTMKLTYFNTTVNWTFETLNNVLADAIICKQFGKNAFNLFTLVMK